MGYFAWGGRLNSLVGFNHSLRRFSLRRFSLRRFSLRRFSLTQSVLGPTADRSACAPKGPTKNRTCRAGFCVAPQVLPGHHSIQQRYVRRALVLRVEHADHFLNRFSHAFCRHSDQSPRTHPLDNVHRGFDWDFWI